MGSNETPAIVWEALLGHAVGRLYALADEGGQPNQAVHVRELADDLSAYMELNGSTRPRGNSPKWHYPTSSDLYRKERRSVECSYCGAPKGAMCVTRKGDATSTIHQPRLALRGPLGRAYYETGARS